MSITTSSRIYNASVAYEPLARSLDDEFTAAASRGDLDVFSHPLEFRELNTSLLSSHLIPLEDAEMFRITAN